MEILEEMRIRIMALIKKYDEIEKESKDDFTKRCDCLSKKLALLQCLSEINDIEHLHMKKYNEKKRVKELYL